MYENTRHTDDPYRYSSPGEIETDEEDEFIFSREDIEEGGPTAVTFNFFGFESPADHPEFETLERWVRWLVWHFELGDVIPSCWAEHDAIAEETAALYEAWTRIYSVTSTKHHPLDQITWLAHLDRSLKRISTRWDRGNCGSRGQHDPDTAFRSVWTDMAEVGSPDPCVSLWGRRREEPFA